MPFTRAAGVLLHPSSLPGRYGIGDLGDPAYRFVDFLVAHKQSLWQILPLGPTGYGDSPYQCFSAFAGNPLLISPDRLVADGYLPPEAVHEAPGWPAHQVDYGPLIEYKNKLLEQAHAHFQARGEPARRQAYDEFCARHQGWLEDFALFMALKAHHQDQEGGVWNAWPEALVRREAAALDEWRRRLAGPIEGHRFRQFLFYDQWLALKTYANEQGIRIIGDLPIFVAFDSADVWANQDLFYLHPDGTPSVVAGVPPDYFSPTGQRWGNPLYRWRKMAAAGYPWWRARLQMALRQTDFIRIDHFRGFEAYWEVPGDEPTAMVGRWVRGPGADFFAQMLSALGDLPIIAEDLGFITPGVRALRESVGFPGMKVLQFAFGAGPDNDFLPHTYEGSNFVVYTGTHDNETTTGWYQNASEEERDHVRRYLATDGREIAWDLIRLAHMSVADVAIIPLQDLLQLGNEARMNFPGRLGGNWAWRFLEGQLSEEVGRRLREITELYGRSPDRPPAAPSIHEGDAATAEPVDPD